MASKTRAEERNEIIHVELVHLNSAIGKLETVIGKLSADLATLQTKELSDLRGDVKVLQYQAKRSGALWGSVSGAVISAIVAGAAALLARGG